MEQRPSQPRRHSRRELLKMAPLACAGMLVHANSREWMLDAGLRMTDAASTLVFRPSLLAPTFAHEEVTPFHYFPINSYLADDPRIDLDACDMSPKPFERGTYNPLQKLAYTVAIALLVALVVTGAALHKPVQLSWLAALLGGIPSRAGLALRRDVWTARLHPCPRVHGRPPRVAQFRRDVDRDPLIRSDTPSVATSVRPRCGIPCG